jgi:hypothetical protein
MREVLVDSFIPVDQNDKPLMARNHGPELWVIILEKAYAKLHGGYSKVPSTLTENALFALTGAPYMKLYTNQFTGDDLFAKIFEYDTKEYTMTTSIASQNDHQNAFSEELQKMGLLENHSYTLLGCANVKDNTGEDCMIVCIRNPWGYFEWNGDWSDHSTKWTEEAKDLVGFVEGEDGIFWMSFQDWSKYFVDLVVCENRAGFKYSSHRMATAEGKNQHDFFMKVFVDKPGDYAFGWHITHKQGLRENYTANFSVVWYATPPKLNSKKLNVDEVESALIGEKEATGYESEKSISCVGCKKGMYVVHVSLAHSGELSQRGGSELKHTFTVYGASSVTLDAKVPEFPTLEVWN